MISEKKREILEKSILGNLSDDELVLFNRYCEDEEFQQEMLLWQEMQPIFEHQGRKRLKTRLEATEKSLSDNKTIKTRILPILIAVAASVTVLIGFLFVLSSERSSEALFAEYFAPAENTVFLITRGSEELSIEAQAYSAYGGGQYLLANRLFDQLEGNDTISFYKAIGQLEMGNFDEAKNTLGAISFGADTYLQESKEWYLALAHLAKNELKESVKILRTITADDHHYQTNEAKALLAEL